MFITRGVLKGDGYRIGGGISPCLSHTPSLRQDAYSTRRLQGPPLRAPRDVVILHYFFEPTRARRAPAAAGLGTHPKKQATERSRRRPERARNARPLAADAARKKLDAPSAAARRRPGPAGCARPSWPSRGRPPRMRAPPAAVPPWPGRFQRLTRGASSGRPTRGRRGRATRRRTCGPRPPEARSGATEPRTRLGGRHTARQQGSERSRAQNANSARARRPRSRKEASRRVLGRRRRPRRENCVRKGGAVPFWRPIGLSHESEPRSQPCKALAQLRLAMDESTFLFTSESVSEGHPGIPYND